MSTATADSSLLKISLGAGLAGMFDAGLPVLAGQAEENVFGAAQPAGRSGAMALFEARGWLLGAATVPVHSALEKVSQELYEDIFRATRGLHLARIWNYVPAINQPGPAGLENYRIFCRGRSLAFERQYGAGFKVKLPSASAVGTKSAALTIVFAAGPVAPRHVENPLQVPAYDYPGEYGPRAPSFARATVVREADLATAFISGTAAIRGHATVAPGNVRLQLDCALENLREISHACGLGPNLGQGGGGTRHFKVYLRHAADHPLVAAILQERLLTGADRVSYLHADICRTPLLVEIEASLFGAALRPA